MPAIGWQEVGSFGGPGVVEHVLAVAYGADQFVGVGVHYATGQLPDTGPVPHEGRVWLSPDGESWEQLESQPTFDDATLTSLVTAKDGSLIAFGRVNSFDLSTGADDSQAVAWRSSDGRRWERMGLGLPSGLWIREVVLGSQGYLLSASSSEQLGAAELWLSDDGLSWERVHEGAPQKPIIAVAAGDEGFVALLAGESGDARATMASADGREWFEGDALAGYGPLTSLGGDWITVTSSVQEPPVSIDVWSSANGLDWSSAASIHDPHERDTFGHAAGLTSAGSRAFLSAGLFNCCGSVAVPGGVWSSADGTTWEQTDITPDGLVEAGAEHDGIVILAGYVGVAQGHATLWVNRRP